MKCGSKSYKRILTNAITPSSSLIFFSLRPPLSLLYWINSRAGRHRHQSNVLGVEYFSDLVFVKSCIFRTSPASDSYYIMR